MGNGLNYPGHNFIKASNHPRKSSTIILSFNPSLQKVYYPNQEKFVPIDSLLLKDDFPKIVLLPLCSLSMSKRKKKEEKNNQRRNFFRRIGGPEEENAESPKAGDKQSW